MPGQIERISGFRRAELLILLGLLQAIAPVSIDMYLAAMPAMETYFATSAAAVQGTMVTFLIGFALGQLLYGPVTDRFGRKPPLYFSLALFVGCSAACAIAPSIGVMSGMRLLQAIGACGGSVISRAIVRDVFPPAELRKVFSILILVLGVSPVIAPMLGSYLLLWFGWQSAFIAQAIVGTFALAGIHFRLSETLDSAARRPLKIGAVKSAYATLLRDRTFVGASVVCGFSSAGVFAYIAASPFVFIDHFGIASENFGWLFGAIAAGMVLFSQINGNLPDSIPLWKVLRMANLVQLVAGLVLLALVVGDIGGVWSVFAGVFIYVAAQGFVFPNGSAIAMMRHPEIAGSASAMLGVNQFLIAAFATSFLGYLENPAIPMAALIAAAAIASTILNYMTLGPRLETMPESV